MMRLKTVKLLYLREVTQGTVCNSQVLQGLKEEGSFSSSASFSDLVLIPDYKMTRKFKNLWITYGKNSRECAAISLEKKPLSIQPKISWYLSAQWSQKYQNKHDSTLLDLQEKFLPNQDLLSCKAGFTETPASYVTSTPDQKKTNKKNPKKATSKNSQTTQVTGQIKMFLFLPTGWIRAKRCATIIFSQIGCCSSSIHGVYFTFLSFFPSFKCKPHCLSNTQEKESFW